MNKNHLITLLTAIVSVICFVTVSTVEINAQTRKKPVKKTLVKRKSIVRKTPVKRSAVSARQIRAFPIGGKYVKLDEATSSTSGAPSPAPKSVSRGVINGYAESLIKPDYPAAAKAVRADGAVNVRVTIDEAGNVIAASALSGHPLLRAASEQAAHESKFRPALLSGQAVKVTGVIVYNFVAQ